MKISLLSIATVAALTTSAAGQSFNIDVGQPGAGPPDTYAAAGQAGRWVSLPATQGQNYLNLVDVDGQFTNVWLSQFGGTDTLLVVDPDIAGDDATLMNDFLITHTTIENCLFFHNMQPGSYEVIVYARMPAQPDVLNLTSVDQEFSIPHYEVGGEWTGDHELFVTYSIHTAVVTGNGLLGMHSGVPTGGDFGIGAALNGVQIRKLPACAEDINDDGGIDVQDLVTVITEWGPCDPSCPADVTNDDVVDVADLVAVILAWGDC